MMKKFLQFLKNWTLVISMICGASSYFIARDIPLLRNHSEAVITTVTTVQPVLIFAMLFITFCKVDPRDLRLRRWHVWLLAIQVVSFALLSFLLVVFPDMSGRVVVEGAMLCLICPTATAGAVVTAKLGGDAAGLTTYTILINLLVAIVVPTFVPLVHPHSDYSFITSFFLIMGKVFPMLICPFFAAMLVRWLLPTLHERIVRVSGLAFYIWAFSLALAIAVTTRSMVHTDVDFVYQFGIAVASLLCCVIQFAAGRAIGRRYGSPIGAGQSLGQKNTVFAIWMGYTFLTPVSAVAGGFYSVWHNVFNSWQLYKKQKEERQLANESLNH